MFDSGFLLSQELHFRIVDVVYRMSLRLAGDHFNAAFAQVGVLGAGSYSWPVVPTALAFFVGAFLC